MAICWRQYALGNSRIRKRTRRESTRLSGESNIEDQPLDISELLGNTPISPEMIQDIPQEKRAEFLRAIVAFRLQIEHVEQYSGPIPHPGIVERYERTLPGSADRILSMAEEQQTANLEFE